MNVNGFSEDLEKIWLKLKFGGNHELHFRVRNVGEPGYREDDEWRLIDFVVLENDKEEYKILGDESLTADELDALEMTIDDALEGKLKRSWYLYTMEPIFDITVELKPGKYFRFMDLATVYNKSKTFTIDEKRDYTVKPCLIVRGRYQFSNMYVNLNEGNMSKVSLYLKLVKGAVTLKDRRIRSMFRNGILYLDNGRFRKEYKKPVREEYCYA